MESEKIYNIDTSALIYLEKYYPRKDFERVWVSLDLAFRAGRVYIIDNVWAEVQAYTDPHAPLVLWVKERKDIMTRRLSDKHIVMAAQIVRENPEIVKDNASVDSAIKENADAYVIAHSAMEKTTLLTGEKKYLNPKPSQIRIPHVCDKYAVEYVCLKASDQEAMVPLHLIQTLGLNKEVGPLPTAEAEALTPVPQI